MLFSNDFFSQFSILLRFLSFHFALFLTCSLLCRVFILYFILFFPSSSSSFHLSFEEHAIGISFKYTAVSTARLDDWYLTVCLCSRSFSAALLSPLSRSSFPLLSCFRSPFLSHLSYFFHFSFSHCLCVRSLSCSLYHSLSCLSFNVCNIFHLATFQNIYGIWYNAE